MDERYARIILQVRALYEALQRFDVTAAARLGLNLTDLRCVHILREKPLTPGEIGQRIGLTSGSVTALIDRLTRRRVLARLPAEGDRRSFRVALDPDYRARGVEVYSVLASALGDRLAAEGEEAWPDADRLFDALIASIINAGDDLAAQPIVKETARSD